MAKSKPLVVAVKAEVADLIPRLRRFFADHGLVVISKSAIPQPQAERSTWGDGFNTAVDQINAAVAAGEAAMAVEESKGTKA